MAGLDMREFFVYEPAPMYVQRWTAADVLNPLGTVVFVHGGAHNGMCWTTTPDGREGWALHLARRGWTVLVVDWPGHGRSPAQPDFLTAGPEPIVAAIAELVRSFGPVVLVAHSIGAALCVRVLDEAPELVTSFLAINPAPPGIMDTGRPTAPEDQPIDFHDLAQFVFANADRFPHEHFASYQRALCGLSPSVFNPLSTAGGWKSLAAADRNRIRSVSSMVIAGDADQLANEVMSKAVAEYLGCDHIVVGRDWGLHGHGHMIPIEDQSETILFRALDKLAAT